MPQKTKARLFCEIQMCGFFGGPSKTSALCSFPNKAMHPSAALLGLGPAAHITQPLLGRRPFQWGLGKTDGAHLSSPTPNGPREFLYLCHSKCGHAGTTLSLLLPLWAAPASDSASKEQLSARGTASSQRRQERPVSSCRCVLIIFYPISP